MTHTACTNPARAAALLLGLLVLVPALVVAQNTNDRCQRCHGEPWIKERTPSSLAAMVRPPASGVHELRDPGNLAGLYVSTEQFTVSAHGMLSCEECHPGIQTLPHSQRVDYVSCSTCHADQSHEVTLGLHDPSKPGTPNCMDCHGDVHVAQRVGSQRTIGQARAMIAQCSTCHAGTGAHGFDPAQTFHDSIHGDAIYRLGLVQGPLCTDCHGTHAMLPTSHPDSPLHLTNVADTCGSCHMGIVEIYENSIHGMHIAQGRTDSATCTSCHHSHGIEHTGPSFLRSVVEECSTCHLDYGKSYLRSYHGKATQLGSESVAVCSSCHGAHDILPASHPESHVAFENLTETCGTCHPGANERFIQYIAHIDYTDRNTHPAVFYTFWGMTILLCSVLLAFIPHTILWFQRAMIGKLKGEHSGHKKNPRLIRRFSLRHRITHGLIVVSFLGLVATGFPLKYSYTEWAPQITAAFGGLHAMGMLHRFFAILTLVYVGIHVAHLVQFFVKDCPRPRWRYLIGPNSMLLTWTDLKDLVAMLRWFFWLGPRPRFGRWTYFEKFDYWGEIWGVIVIGGSGLLLWMPVLFTKWLPGWSLNVAMVIHSIEALLAASVIFLVHFFNTHLRPEKFPIDMTMWTGAISEDELKEERASQYEEMLKNNTLEENVVEPMSLRLRILGTILGISAFLFGIFLIILAIRTEITSIFG